MTATQTERTNHDLPGRVSATGVVEVAASPGAAHEQPRDLSRFDRIGAFASGACAVHCAATPFVLMLAPVLGAVWADPIVHWIIAGVSLPLAALVLTRGYRRHQKRWIATSAAIGITAIVVGLWIPGLPGSSAAPNSAQPHASSAACQEHCCPTLHVSDAGTTQLTIPPASIATFIGGVFLVLAHIGNLRSCRCH